jgi:CubicO group peptidase (beta-lactamase class C family)
MKAFERALRRMTDWFCEGVEIDRRTRLNRPMNFRARLILLLATGFLANSASAAVAGGKLPASFDLSAIDAFLSSQVREANRVGLSVVIVKDGQVVLAKGYGKRSLQDGRSVEADTIFAIGSVSKQFTCVAALLLAEDGKLSVNDPVAKYYPNLTRAKDITLLDLMNHVSGYPDYYPLDFVDRRMQRPIAEDELVRQYGGAKLDFEPGSKYSYSNTGYILLGRIVEKVSGENLGAFLTRRIFKPLGMERTVYEPDLSDARLAKGYTTFALSAAEPVAPEGKGWLSGAGGIYSTPTDLARWNLALMSGKVLKPESYALMTAPRKLTGGRISEYGCGLSVKTQGGRQVLSHNGAVSGFNASSAMIPSTRSAVIMTCNLDGGLGALPGQVFALLLKEPSLVPAVKASPAVETVKTVFAQIQRGSIDRQKFSEEFNLYLTDKKLSGASKRLKPYGTPKSAEVLSINERGGMEVTTTRLTFARGGLRTLMYRMPDGKIEQFFVSKE